MKFSVKAATWVVAMSFIAGAAMAEDKPTAEVMHWWVSGGESAAIKEVAKAYEAAGGVWKDNATAGGEVAIPAIIARITGGNPPTAAQMPLGKQLDDLVAQGLLAPLDDAAKETGFLDALPETFKNAVVYPDGHMYALPINDHGHNWVWFNNQVLADAGVKAPVTWDDLFADLDAIKAKGNAIPLAVGAQNWQLGIMQAAIVLTKEGSGVYYKVFKDHDVEAVKSPEFKDAMEAFLKLRDYTDAGSANREWNVTTNMVITGKAGFQFMGDWAKGEFLAAGQTPGKEFGCALLGNGDGAVNFQMSSDAIIFPVNSAAGQPEAQALLEKTIMSKDVQVAFNLKKGSVPARLDVDTSQLDVCSKAGIDAMQKPEQRISDLDFIATPDFIGAQRDLAAQAWADPSMTADQLVEAFAKIVADEKAND